MVCQPNITQPDASQAERWADQLQHAIGGTVYATSIITRDELTFALQRDGRQRFLLLLSAETSSPVVDAFTGTVSDIRLDGHALKLKRCPADAANAAALREHLPYTKPILLGLAKSFGCGDRLGLGTAGHILAAKRHPDFRPILAQQSIREMTRTQRTAQQVMDDASWGVFQAGWLTGFGSDADHLKTTADIELCVAAGFLMFTIDPGEHVDDAADHDDAPTLAKKVAALPWSNLNSTADEFLTRYARTMRLPSGDLTISAEQANRAAAKYGRAIAHTVTMYRKCVELKGEGNFELEMSVDETATPTSPQEHYIVASELKRLGVTWASLAPRFVGDFEKGVDYIGDLNVFRKQFAQHAAIAKALGPYKLSVHSGSDKFSVYPIVAELTHNVLHVKTAGTSYLEALRVLSQLEPSLFREILDFCRAHYTEDRASYHVSADVAKVPVGKTLADHQLPPLLEDYHTREVLHVTFGSVMTTQNADGTTLFRDRILDALIEHEEAYQHTLDRHIGKHMDLLK